MGYWGDLKDEHEGMAPPAPRCECSAPLTGRQHAAWCPRRPRLELGERSPGFPPELEAPLLEALEHQKAQAIMDTDEPEIMRELHELEAKIRSFMEKLEAGAGGYTGPAPARLRRMQITGGASVLLNVCLEKLTAEERRSLLISMATADYIANALGKPKR